MNSPASSEKSWGGWDHHHNHHQQHHHHHQQQQQQQHHHHHHNSQSALDMSVGLETRQFQGGGLRGALDYEWGSSPVLLSGPQAMNGTGENADERKPQIMLSGHSLMDGSHGLGLGQYNNGNGSHVNLNVVALNGMLSSGMPLANNPLANLLSGGSSRAGGYAPGGGGSGHVLEGLRSVSASSLYSGSHNILSGFGYSGSDSRAALEEQRQHLLGMIGMDQKSIFHNIVKHEELCAGDFQARIGLNLGGRTYFSAEDNIVNRLYKRPRAISPGSQVPRCQAEGCKADLSTAKHYHRRHKVCELHSKAANVISGGISQRFCQQCSRFHVLSEFDEGKRSCRKRLADHNRRRRKPQPNTALNAPNAEGAAPNSKPAEDQETNSGSNQSNVQSEVEGQGLLTGISLSPSLPLVLQSSKGQQQYLQQTSPNLPRGEMGVDYPRHTTGEKYHGLEIAIPWLKPADSSSEFGGSEKNSSNGQVSESGASSSTVQVFSSIQNLLPSTELGTSDWMVNGNISGSNNARNNHQHYGSADLNLQTSLEGQRMLSLLEKNGPALGRQDTQNVNAVEYMSQGGLNSKHVDGHSELSTGFSGMHSLRSMYQNIL